MRLDASPALTRRGALAALSLLPALLPSQPASALFGLGGAGNSPTVEVLEQPEGGGGLKDYGWFHTGDIGIGSSCRFINDSSASLRQVPPEDDSGNTPVAKGKVVNIT